MDALVRLLDSLLTEIKLDKEIADEAACITYYLACMESEKERYRLLFHAVSRDPGKNI